MGKYSELNLFCSVQHQDLISQSTEPSAIGSDTQDSPIKACYADNARASKALILRIDNPRKRGD